MTQLLLHSILYEYVGRAGSEQKIIYRPRHFRLFREFLSKNKNSSSTTRYVGQPPNTVHKWKRLEDLIRSNFVSYSIWPTGEII